MFNEALDFSCLVFDGKVEMAAQAPFVPAPDRLDRSRRSRPRSPRSAPENLSPGDVVFTNDPYRGDCHLPEFVRHQAVLPRRRDPRLLREHRPHDRRRRDGPRRVRRHAQHVAGGHPLPSAQDLRRGREVEEIFRILISNVRTPKHSYGDMKAMIGSLYLAERRIDELVTRYGSGHLRAGCEDIKLVSERLMRAEIASWPDGEYEAEGLIEDDGVVPDRPWKIKVTVVIRGDELIVDFTGSDPQCVGRGEPDVRHDGVGRVQRRAPHVQERHPVQPRLLPADRDRDRARKLRQRELPGLDGRRELRHASDDGRHHPARLCAVLARFERRRRRYLRLHRLRRRGSTHERGVRPPPSGGRRVGRPGPTTTGTTCSSSRTGTARTPRSRSRRRATRG